jgi:hypothetical protein
VGEPNNTKTIGSFRGKGHGRLSDAEKALSIMTTVKKKQEKHGRISYCTSNDEIVPFPQQLVVSARLQWDP